MKLRSTVWLLVLGLAFFALASTGSQCSQTTEPTLSPRTVDSESFFDPCKTHCWSDYFQARLAEGKRFWAALRDCDNNRDCINTEFQVHASILAELNADLEDCLLACQHQQGSATGGQ